MNQGLTSEAIQALRDRCQKSGKSFILNDEIENTDESVCFYFVGEYKGKAVIFDACLYTLRIEYEMELYEEAEARTDEEFEDFDLESHADNEEAMAYFNKMLKEIQKEKSIEVNEYINFDETVEYGIGMDICLNVKEVTDAVIEKFITQFNKGTFKADSELRSFEIQKA
ncbi:MAG: hypothetical protein JJT94_11885 [Bernardetiaceae bacterium]|nr:hypothetical protein [Bernardetiaceae bacterium]